MCPVQRYNGKNLQNIVHRVPKLCAESILEKLLKIIFVSTVLIPNVCINWNTLYIK